MVNEISFSARMPTMQSDHDERHLVLECPAMQVAVRAGSVHCIVQSCKNTMQLFIFGGLLGQQGCGSLVLW